MFLKPGKGGEAFVAQCLSRHTNHLCKQDRVKVTGARAQESALLCVQYTSLQVQELLFFVCLKLLIMSQGFTMLGGVTYRSKGLSLKNLYAEQSRARRILCKEMMKLFHSAVCLLNSPACRVQ